MITSNTRVACLNFQFGCTHKCLRVNQKCEETSSGASGLITLNWVGLRNGRMGGLQKLITVLSRFDTYKGGVLGF
jgi:hypothetical protein